MGLEVTPAMARSADPPTPTGTATGPDRHAGFVIGVGLLGATALGLSIAAAASGLDAITATSTVVVAGWAAAALVLALRCNDSPGMALWPALVALGAAATMLGGAHWSGFLATAGLGLTLCLPTGRLSGRIRWGAMVVMGFLAATLALAGGDAPAAAAPGLVGLAAVLATLGFWQRCENADENQRASLQLVGWAVLVVATTATVLSLLGWLVAWPPGVMPWAIAVSLVLPATIVAATFEQVLRTAPELLAKTIGIAGGCLVVCAVYVVVVVGLGHVPTSDERSVLALSMLAAALGVLLAIPARRSFERSAHERTSGVRHTSGEALRTFSTRMSRAIPMDELQLQLVELLRSSLALESAELWTGSQGVLDRVASVPHRGAARLLLEPREIDVASRARVSGSAWLQVWIPALIEGREGDVRVASVAHQGELLGLIVVERPSGGVAFDDEEDALLSDLARPLGLALHNVRLDSALQASLDELESRNAELQASRLRIVSAADESRRRIERNLHDGAQQHLVALAVKLGLARQLMDGDETAAGAMLDELRGDVQTTLEELRELAHGIYPPLLRDRGLPEALRTAANRSVLPTAVVAQDDVRFTPEVEAAVYFCCLEALQNAGKYAGERSEVTITVDGSGDSVCFSVSDTGTGFDSAAAVEGHGFTNMRDRLGAIGGELEVVSSPGAGTTVSGTVPLADAHEHPHGP